MKLLWQRTWVTTFLTVAAILASALVAMSAPAQRFLAPGDIRQDHAGHKLKCDSCHEPFRGIPNEKCLKCHQDITAERVLRKGLHGATEGSCVNCHSSHDVPDKPAVAVDPLNVDHAWTRFDLSEHQRQICSDCHGSRVGRFDKKMSRRCAACHISVAGNTNGFLTSFAFARSKNEPATFAAHVRGVGDRCLNCHDGDGRVVYRHESLARRFLTGGHAGRTCGECHVNENYDLKKTCVTCHRPVHGRTLATGCDRCHNLEKWSVAKPEHRGKLGGAHVKLKCGGCHAGGRYSGLSWNCDDCHETKHPPSFGNACVGCHNQTKWKPAKIDHKVFQSACRECHEGPSGHSGGDCAQCHSTRTWKAATYRHSSGLSGRHSGLSCSSCHKGGKYGGLSGVCTACHGVKHNGGYSRSCAICHNQSRWSAAMNHAGVTWACASCHSSRHNGGYSASCDTCHNQARWKPAAMNHGGVVWACASCHNAPGGHYSGNCSQCHSTGTWKGATARHAINVAGHGGLGCRACHTNGGYGGLNWACATCHGSPHNGGYGSNCAACHSGSRWKPASFNHGAVQGDCSACHEAPGKHASGACRTCHQNTGGWSSSFNHPGVREHSYTSFPCASCHPSGYGSVDCTGCHRGGVENDD